ncbi:type I-E CRISPR-associated protein Cse2/CasB [Aeromicrobium sp. PE09-221]|uniref:type I-E CRISPR-associated protein Cse2/CasB n=1 Tax=Aeromicrobium sp. PE09-221 TaxID=1898043 RepID=UPI000B3EBBBB|nr:type I-E CRISPR-associated protein Cse2/CasB [Aeromicrobium sp. PE09-221]OUZ08648.1 type I-E CRISPR-associated protein Cse2/CasB [Aeromicrobium sp. PE09-221]
MTDELPARIGAYCRVLAQDYQKNTARAVADLAILRRGLGKRPGDDLASWGIILRAAGHTLNEHTESPTRREWAAHTALTLFAYHQQSERSRPMHRESVSIGSACRALIKASGESSEEPIRRRFHALGTSTSIAELSHHARSIVGLLRAEDIAMDYARFTRDLISWQYPDAAANVRLRWGRDFYRLPSNDDPIDEGTSA